MRKTIFSLICSVLLVFLSIVPAMALAQSVDQQPVIDGAKIFGTRTGEVEAAASKLSSLGADIRIRTISTYGAAGNLDQYEAQLEKQSPSWIGQDGTRKNNLVVLLISVQERQTGLYYGSIWDNSLSGNWLRIQTDIMNPLFRNNDYTGGTLKGLEEIQRLIQGNGQPQPGTQTGAGSSLWWIIVLVIVLFIIGLLLFLNNSKKRAGQRVARQKAMLAKQGAASGINELNDALQMLEAKVDVTAGKVAAEEATALREGLKTAKNLIDQSSETYSELSHSAGDPENPKLGEAELGAIETEYQKVLSKLRQAREAIKGVEDQVAVVQQAVDGFPGKVAEVHTAIENALRKQDELQKAGFKTTYPSELLAKGRNSLEQAEALGAGKRFIEGMKNASLAGDQIQQAIQATEELPQKKQEAEAAIPALAARIEQVKDTVNKGRDIFEKFLQGYAETTWQSVRGNGTEAENRVNWALDACDHARSAIGVEEQDWFKALDLVGKGNNWLTEAESFMKSISELEVNLQAAQRDAPNEISAAQADVAKAWDYIKQYDDDIRESLEDDLRAAEKNNALASEELQKGKPDYFMVNKLAREANDAADKILLQARDEHETAERLRAKAASTLRDATAKVSMAREYFDDHHANVRNEARGYLNHALEALRQANNTTDSNTQVALALQAESSADQAYALAQSDVNSSWEEPQDDVNSSWEKPRPSSNMPNTGLSNIIIPTVISTVLSTVLSSSMRNSRGGNMPWGSSRSSGPGLGNIFRPGGGGSSGWGSGGGGGHGGGGSTGW
jgi:uncharacterized membrane protein YgcG